MIIGIGISLVIYNVQAVWNDSVALGDNLTSVLWNDLKNKVSDLNDGNFSNGLTVTGNISATGNIYATGDMIATGNLYINGKKITFLNQNMGEDSITGPTSGSVASLGFGHCDHGNVLGDYHNNIGSPSCNPNYAGTCWADQAYFGGTNYNYYTVKCRNHLVVE